MAQKTANLYARIEPEIKEQAESILSALGISTSNAINMFYKQIILHQGIPFKVTLPKEKPLNMSEMTKEELLQELEKGLEDIRNGRVYPAEEVFEELNKELDMNSK